MSPVHPDPPVLDWMAALGLPLILVAGSYLGTISHTLTALDAVARRGLVVASLVISESADSPVKLGETREAIAHFAPEIDIVALPRIAGRPTHPTFDRIADRL